MAKAAFEYSDEEWSTLGDTERAAAWDITAAALKKTLARFDFHAPGANARWQALTDAIENAIMASVKLREKVARGA